MVAGVAQPRPAVPVVLLLVGLQIVSKCTSLSSESNIAAPMVAAAGTGKSKEKTKNCYEMLSQVYKWTTRQRVANCQGLELVTVPHNLDVQTVMLVLTDNKITKLHESSFQNYPKLVVLRLDRNKLAEITLNAFKPLKALEVLSMKENFLTLKPYVKPGVFHPLQELKILELDGNPLGEVEPYYFQSLKKLEKLCLNDSRPLKLHPKSLMGLSSLSFLDLSNCGLTTLHRETRKAFNLMALNRLNLQGNPWHCDCRIKWLVSWYKNQPTANKPNYKDALSTDTPVCAGPVKEVAYPRTKNLKNVQLFDKATDVIDFACKPRPYPPLLVGHTRNTQVKPPVIHADSGANITLTCKFTASPKGESEWFKGSTKVAGHWRRFTVSQNSIGNPFNTTLIIRNVMPEDSAQYRCVHHNIRGKSEQIRNLKVGAEAAGPFGKFKILLVVGAILAIVIVVLTTMAIFIYCFYCRQYEGGGQYRTGKHNRGVRQMTPGDDESAMALYPTDNGGQPPPGSGGQHQQQAPIIAGVPNNTVDENGFTTVDRIQRKRVLASMSPPDQPSVEHRPVPLSAEVRLDAEQRYSTLPTSFGPQRALGMTGTLPHQSNVAAPSTGAPSADCCPVHGSRSSYSPCPVHGDSRAGTPQLLHHTQMVLPTGVNSYGTLPCRPSTSTATSLESQQAVAAAAAAAAGYKPCPLHGDYTQHYGTLPNAASLAAAAAAAAAANQQQRNQQLNLMTSPVPPVNTQTLPQPLVNGTSTSSSNSDRSSQPQLRPSGQTTSGSSVGGGSIGGSIGTYVRASKVDDCIIPEETAGSTSATNADASSPTSAVPEAAVSASNEAPSVAAAANGPDGDQVLGAVAAGGASQKLQDDEGYSTAV